MEESWSFISMKMSDSFCFISPVKFCLPCRACCCWSCRFYQPVFSCFLLDLLWLSGYCTSPVWDTVSSLVLYSLYVINNIKLKGKLADDRSSYRVSTNVLKIYQGYSANYSNMRFWLSTSWNSRWNCSVEMFLSSLFLEDQVWYTSAVCLELCYLLGVDLT